MIQPYTRLRITDNSGAKEVSVIRVIGGAKANAAQIGDMVVCTVKTASPNGQVKRHEVVKVVIVRQKFPYQRADGSVLRFDDNAGVIVNADKTMRGTRVLGPVAREIRDNGFGKIISLAPEIV